MPNEDKADKKEVEKIKNVVKTMMPRPKIGLFIISLIVFTIVGVLSYMGRALIPQLTITFILSIVFGIIEIIVFIIAFFYASKIMKTIHKWMTWIFIIIDVGIYLFFFLMTTAIFSMLVSGNFQGALSAIKDELPFNISSMNTSGLLGNFGVDTGEMEQGLDALNELQ